MIDRRIFLAGSGAMVVLAGCSGPSAPGALSVSATGADGMNPGPDGADRPLTLTVVQLTSPAAFESADFYALQQPADALGDTLLQADQIVVTPSGTASQVIGLDPNVEVIGVIAGYRTPAGKAYRATAAAPDAGDAGLIVSVGSGGISLQSA